MFKSIAIASLLTTAAIAQNSTANPLIPTDISPGCTSFLNSLNTDSSLTSCLKTMSDATSAFAPGSTSTPSTAAVTSALNNLCSDSANATCSDTVFRSKITAFYAACSAELTSNPKQDVVRIYDVLYTLTPLKQSVCSKDDTDSWCALASSTTTREVSEEASGDSTLTLRQLLNLLYTDNSALKRRAEVAAIVPNITTYHDLNLPFLFLKPDLDATKLCTTCTRNVLTNYITFESNTPYAPGLSQSTLLDTQTPLYESIQQKCPSNFLTGAVQAAGGIGMGNNPFSKSGAVASISTEQQTVLALAMGVMSLAVSFGL